MGSLRLKRLPGSGGSTGSAVMNLGGVDIGNGSTGAAFLDFMKTAQAGAQVPTNEFDSYGYPIGNASGTLSGANYSCNLKIPTSQQTSATEWVVTWPATREFSFVVNQAVNVTGGINKTQANGASGSLTVRPSTRGQAGYIKFKFTGTPTASVSCYFEAVSRYNQSGQSGEIKFMRVSDCTDTGIMLVPTVDLSQNRNGIFTPEFISIMKLLRQKTIRPMGWQFPGSADYANDVKWAYRTVPGQLSYCNYTVKAQAYGGVVSGNDTYTMASLPSDSTSSWVHNEVLQGTVTNGSTDIWITGAANNGSGNVRLTLNRVDNLATSQSIWILGVPGTAEANGVHTITAINSTNKTIDIDVAFAHTYTGDGQKGSGQIGSHTITVTGKTGTKFLCDTSGYPLHTNDGTTAGGGDGLAGSSTGTFIYDRFLDRVIAMPFGINNTVPIEHQVSLANLLNANLWICIPPMVTTSLDSAGDDFAGSIVAYSRDNISSGLLTYVEYGNELWNNGFPLTGLCYNRGLAIGWANSADSPLHGWYGARYRQIMGDITSQWQAAKGNLTGLRRVIAFQGAGRPSQTIPKRLQGNQLNSSSAANYSTFGFSDYSTAGNRPIDYCDVEAYATYYSGSYFTNGGFGTRGQGFYNSSHPEVSTFMQALVNDYAAGNTASALATLNTDIRSGAGPNAAATLLGLASTAVYSDSSYTGMYPVWTNELTNAGVLRPIECYEGGLETGAPTTDQCTDLGISCAPIAGGAATAAGASEQLTALLELYKNTAAMGKQIVKDQFDQARTGGITSPAWLSLTGPNQWAFFPNDIFANNPYQTLYGFSEWT